MEIAEGERDFKEFVRIAIFAAHLDDEKRPRFDDGPEELWDVRMSSSRHTVFLDVGRAAVAMRNVTSSWLW